MEKHNSVKKFNQKVTVHSPEVKKQFLKELRYRMNPRKGILFKSRPCATYMRKVFPCQNLGAASIFSDWARTG